MTLRSGPADQGKGRQMERDTFLGCPDPVLWQKSMKLVIDCYQITADFHEGKVYGLTSQLRLAAVSVDASIAEGRGLHDAKYFLNYLSNSYSSLTELETHRQIAKTMNYIDLENIERLLTQTSVLGEMINDLRQALLRRLAGHREACLTRSQKTDRSSGVLNPGLRSQNFKRTC